jgi:hypothetical protein
MRNKSLGPSETCAKVKQERGSRKSQRGFFRSGHEMTVGICLTLVLSITLAKGVTAVAQESTSPPPGSKDTPNSNQTLDQLIQQNQQLEKQNEQMEKQNQQLQKQNEELMEKINALRGGAGQPGNASEQAAEGAPGPSTGAKGGQQAGQSSSQGNTGADDRTRYPQGSEGNPAIFGDFNPGRGFLVGRGEYGELNLSGLLVARFLDQMPANQSASDHLGRPILVTPRKDFQVHRTMLFTQGWLFSPKFKYLAFLWSLQDTNQIAFGGAVTYDFGKVITLGIGWNGYPGTQSLQSSHPYWFSYDRVMADEFFRPFFSQGLFAKGNLLPRLEYRWMFGNNLSNLDVQAIKFDRNLSAAGAITWLPTTGEFGPRGGFGDYEDHQNLATRFNLAYSYSPELRQAPVGTPAGNTTIRLSDSLNVFDTGAFAPGVTVEKVHYQMASAAAGIKYRGLWLQSEGYERVLSHFVADGKLPVSTVRDSGFYVQSSYMLVPKRFELYGATSYIFGQYGNAREWIVGGNYYPWNTRNIKLNTLVINADHSAVSSNFGFYTGQQTGPILAIGIVAFY